MSRVNERSTAWVEVRLRGRADDPVTPATLSYQIDCLTSRTAIRPPTALPPGSMVEIRLTPTDNRIVTADHAHEIRQMTVVATFGAEDQQTAVFTWQVMNLVGLS